jgi:hypothetical protein
MRPYLKQNTSQKRAGRVAQGVDPEFKPQYCQKTPQKPHRYLVTFTELYNQTMEFCYCFSYLLA